VRAVTTVNHVLKKRSFQVQSISFCLRPTHVQPTLPT
jgi:hypothetical protein